MSKRTLLKKGPKVRCSRSGRYFYYDETVPDGKGGRIAKVHDFLLHNQWKNQTKHKEGPGWQRGGKLRFASGHSDGTTFYLIITSDQQILSGKNYVAISTTS